LQIIYVWEPSICMNNSDTESVVRTRMYILAEMEIDPVDVYPSVSIAEVLCK
jgi:hypothetical protein